MVRLRAYCSTLGRLACHRRSQRCAQIGQGQWVRGRQSQKVSICNSGKAASDAITAFNDGRPHRKPQINGLSDRPADLTDDTRCEGTDVFQGAKAVDKLLAILELSMPTAYSSCQWADIVVIRHFPSALNTGQVARWRPCSSQMRPIVGVATATVLRMRLPLIK